jgi:DNA-binding PadR family transcriptional regulator
MADKKNWTITATEAALLGLLTRGEMSGYDVQNVAETSGGFFWAPAKSRIYAVLPRLVARGFATSRSVVQETRPTKQLYRITRAGRDALQLWLEEPPSMEPERAPLLLKIYFGELLEPEVLVSHVRKLKVEADALIERLGMLDPAPTTGSLFSDLTVRHGIEWAQAMSRWAENAEREIEARLALPATPAPS